MKITKINQSVLILVLLFSICSFSVNCNQKSGFHDFCTGDIIFQTSRSVQSRAIQLATLSPYSHVGIIYKKGKEILVLEAVQPVKLTPVKKWINRGEGEKFVLKRLNNASKYLTRSNMEAMKKIGEAYLGKNYDSWFEWSDERMYCSELVWKIYKKGAGIELGKQSKLGSFDFSNPLVKAKLNERYGSKIPLNEPVISPAAIFNSDKLVTVYKSH